MFFPIIDQEVEQTICHPGEIQRFVWTGIDGGKLSRGKAVPTHALIVPQDDAVRPTAEDGPFPPQVIRPMAQRVEGVVPPVEQAPGGIEDQQGAVV